MTATRLGRRQVAQLRLALSDRDRAIVCQVSELKLMSARQIEAVHFPASQHATKHTAARTCRRVLERLVRDRLLVRLGRRDVGGINAGSASWLYAATSVTTRVLGDRGPRRRFREPSAMFVTHTLAVAQLVVDLLVAAHENKLELLELEAEPTCWRAISSATRAVLRPDLFVAIGVGEFELRWFCEVDCASESMPAVAKKCAIYQEYFDSGREQAAHGVFPRVVWLVPDEHRKQRLEHAIRRARVMKELFVVAQRSDALDVLRGHEAAEPIM